MTQEARRCSGSGAGRSLTAPTLLLIAGALLSGFCWAPMRYLDSLGVHSAWAGGIAFGLGGLAVLPLATRSWRRHDLRGLPIVTITLALGAAWALYTFSLAINSVARALVLYYAAPIWGALFSYWLLGERPTGLRILAVALCTGGLIVLLSDGMSLSFPPTLGDAAALLAGMLWAYGCLIAYASEGIRPPVPVCGSLLVGCAVSTLLLVLLPAELRGPAPVLSSEIIGLLALYGAGLLLPVTWLLFDGARQVPPARACLIIALETAVAVGSAALFAGEPFGVSEAAGSLLVILGASVEVFGHGAKPSGAPASSAAPAPEDGA